MVTRRTLTARRLRRDATDVEQILWRHLSRSQLGAKFRRQFPLGPYILDFVSLSARINVELDGSQHAGSAADIERDRFVDSQGFTVLRFWNNDVLCNLDGVLSSICSFIKATSVDPSSSRDWRSMNGFTPPQPSPASGEGANAS